MRKRTLSTLLLAGVMAATMIPTAVFAAPADAKKTTTIGYTAGGNISTDGRVMVTVPMDVDFTSDKTSVSNFDVDVLVWDVNGGDDQTGGYIDPSDTNKIGKTIDVSVTSTNGYKLLDSKNNEFNAGAYTYTLNKNADGTDGSLVLDGKGTSGAGKKVKIGTLQDKKSDGIGANASRYSISGTVDMTKAPTPGKTEKAEFFSDKLTYEFAGLD